MAKYLCIECVGDDFIKQRIKDEGTVQPCSYCKNVLQAVSLSTVAEWVDSVYRETYVPGEQYPIPDEVGDGTSWVTSGETPDDIILNMLDVSEKIAYDIVEILSEDEQHDVIVEGNEALYDHTSDYEEADVYHHQHSDLWNEFCYKVKYKSRFYNSETTKILDDLFSKLDALKYVGDQTPIREIGPGTTTTHIYRARKVRNDEEIIKITKAPFLELGPPPKSKAIQGRMNAQGIPAFYGATDDDVCIAEIRLPVGGKAVIARFEIMKPLKVLDLTVFKRMYDNISLFDPGGDSKASRIHFLREFDERISDPVLLHDNALDYIPTQALAEYLANYYEIQIDAVIYSSSQIKGENKKNIVVLPHAASVAHPQTYQEDNGDPSLRIIWFEDHCHITDSNHAIFLNLDADYLMNDYVTSTNPSLQIVENSIEVIEARSIKYDYNRYDVHISKGKKVKPPKASNN